MDRRPLPELVAMAKYLYFGPCLGLWPFAVGLSLGHGRFLVNGLIPYGNVMVMVMVW